MTRNSLSRVILALAWIALPALSQAQDWASIEVQTVPVAPGIVMLAGAGGNIGVLVGESGTLIVDSQFPQLHDKVVAAITAAGGGPVRFLLNTNWHLDHVSGNELFRQAGAVIVGHEGCPSRMKGEQYHAVLDEKSPVFPIAAWPEITFADSLTLHVNGEDVEAHHAPGAHSDADAFYVFRKANVIHTGDLFFSGGYPYLDITNGGSIDGTIAAADRILAHCHDGTMLIPGHGPLSDPKRLREYQAMLVTIRDRVARLIAEGRTLDQAVAAKVSADLDADWSQDGVTPEQFIALVYGDLTRARSVTGRRR